MCAVPNRSALLAISFAAAAAYAAYRSGFFRTAKQTLNGQIIAQPEIINNGQFDWSGGNSTGAITRAQALSMAANLDAQMFGGFFQDSRHSLQHLMGIWAVESQFNKYNYNPADPSGAWGIGQVLATTAAQHGFNDPAALLQPEAGAIASMTHLVWTWGELLRLYGRTPTTQEWIMAYNAGAAGVAIKGRTAVGYFLLVEAARIV